MKKKFILEVEEGIVPSCKICPLGIDSGLCRQYGVKDGSLLDCNKYDLTTLVIKENSPEDNKGTADQVIAIHRKAMESQKKVLIEKACKWLINVDFDDFHFRDCDESFNNDLFVDAFRKAIEE